MKESYFNNIVKKLLKSRWKIMTALQLFWAIENILDTETDKNKVYKIVYNLKNKGYLISLKKDIYFVKDPNDDEGEILNNNLLYWECLLKQNKSYLEKDWYIWWIKALELLHDNFDIPEKIDIINPYKQSKEVVINKKNVYYKQYANKDMKIFKQMKKFCKDILIDKKKFLCAGLELALLESLYSPDILSSGYSKEYIKKILKKQKKYISYDILSKILALWKHHSSINRLYKIAKGVDEEISKQIAAVIKRRSYFLSQ